MSLFSKFKGVRPTYINDTSSLYQAFPDSLYDDVKEVVKQIGSIELWSIPISASLHDKEYMIPHRVIATPLTNTNFTPVQQMIYQCILSRSTDGYVREASIRQLAKSATTDWISPFLFLSLSDRVVEVSGVTASNSELMESLSKFVHENQEMCRLALARCVSFWDVYYRDRYATYKDYPPYKVLKMLVEIRVQD